eukprot:4141262-Karenia_brevis.AAC.1
MRSSSPGPSWHQIGGSGAILAPSWSIYEWLVKHRRHRMSRVFEGITTGLLRICMASDFVDQAHVSNISCTAGALACEVRPYTFS